MKKALSLIFALVMCLSLCACVKDYQQSTDAIESKMKFESVELMKENVDGVWMNCKTGEYFIIKDGRLSKFANEAIQSWLTKLGNQINDHTSFDIFYSKYLEDTGEKIEYGFENGRIVLGSSGQLLFDLYDNETAFDDSSTMFTKNSITEGELEDILLGYFIKLKYPNVLTNKDVQFDKSGNQYKNFLISGSAELDDYYNWGYRNYESGYFCINIRPTGGSYSDEWHIYASRTDFNELFEILKTGPKSMILIAKMEYADTGSNNMATLVDFFD